MRRLICICCVFLLLVSLAGCKKEEKSLGDAYKETYTGVITNWRWAGGDNGMVMLLTVDIGDEETIVFSTTRSTKFVGIEDYHVNIGDKVVIECESYTKSDYHPIITITLQ